MITLEDQVTSLIFSKQLYEKGLRGDPLFYWVAKKESIEKRGEEAFGVLFIHEFYNLCDENDIDIKITHEFYPAYTSADLDELLPDFLPPESPSGSHSFLEYSKRNSLHCIGYRNYDKYSPMYRFVGFSEKSVNARALLILQLIENKIIEIQL